MRDRIQWLDAGYIGYDQALGIQLKLHEACWQERRGDAILFQESPPVITLGKSSHRENLLWTTAELDAAGIDVREVGRGGDITYHGPGQLIISPILHFRRFASTALEYLRMLEETVIRLLNGYGVKAGRIGGKTGVWVGENKIAAVGVAVSHSVTMHGIAINVCPDMDHFSAIIPCGLQGMGVTSLEALGCGKPPLSDVRDRWLKAFENIFGVEAAKTEGLEA